MISQVTLDPTLDASAGLKFSDLGYVHFVGIGGAGMSVLAEVLLGKGITVSGSDMHESSKIARLRELGAQVMIGQRAENIANADTIIYSSAIKADNPEIVAAFEADMRILHRSDLIAMLMREHRSIAVAGTHGKTTTSSLLATILSYAGVDAASDPTFAIGGSIRTINGVLDGGHAGKGNLFVAEVDESDGSFLKYQPDIAIITNVEADHLNYYGTVDAYHRAFVQFAKHATDRVILCGDDAGAMEVFKALDDDEARRAIVVSTALGDSFDDLRGAEHVLVKSLHTRAHAEPFVTPTIGKSASSFVNSVNDGTVGTIGAGVVANLQTSLDKNSTAEHLSGNVLARAGVMPATMEIQYLPWLESWYHRSSAHEIAYDTGGLSNEQLGGMQCTDLPFVRWEVSLRVPGLHNARNAAQAIMAAVLCGVYAQDAARAASAFCGAVRRFDLKGVVNGIAVIDDYAHHPTEIRALLLAASQRYPQSRLFVLFQPHLYSRTEEFMSEFANVLSLAHHVVVSDIFPAREKQSDFPTITSQCLVEAAQPIHHELTHVKADSNSEGALEHDQSDNARGQGHASWIEYIADKQEAAQYIATLAQPNDVIFTVGAGDITEMGSVILEALQR